ncbi:MAG: hypothetical protein OEZ16_12590 [Chromatiales bacterium]|nr:hypothetical protein [Chromatiales bacterium]
MLKKHLTALLLTAITMWLLAGLWHKVIMAQFYIDETAATHEGTGIIFLAYLILAGLMLLLFPRKPWFKNNLLSGLLFGAVIGLLWVFPHELAMAGAHGEPLGYVFFNAVWHMVEQGAGGIVIAMLYGRSTSSDN